MEYFEDRTCWPTCVQILDAFFLIPQRGEGREHG